MSEWIDIKEQLPPNGESVIAGRSPGRVTAGDVCQARYKGRVKKWVFPSAAMGFEPTHWMAMPEPPK